MAYMKWTPVTERPPEVSGRYLVTHGGSYILSLDTYTTMEDAVRIFNDGYEDYIGWQSQNVIAWMPLPEPYKKDTPVSNDDDAAHYLLKKHSEMALKELEGAWRLAEALHKIHSNN